MGKKIIDINCAKHNNKEVIRKREKACRINCHWDFDCLPAYFNIRRPMTGIAVATPMNDNKNTFTMSRLPAESNGMINAQTTSIPSQLDFRVVEFARIPLT